MFHALLLAVVERARTSYNQLLFLTQKTPLPHFEIDVVRGHTAADVYETGSEILIICSLHTVCNNILTYYESISEKSALTLSLPN
jgi:hypothetical protein